MNSGVHNKAALTYVATERMNNLAQHKKLSKSYVFPKSVVRRVPESAKNFQTTKRLEELAINYPHNVRQKFVKVASYLN